MTPETPRPNPDDLLAHVQQEEYERSRGRLKIFLGYIAGVGKTYAMLEAAHQRKAQGVDLAVGYIETHGRMETEGLLQDLEVIRRKTIQYRGVSLEEMDVDAILARQPKLVLVDELAHTNVSGSRHQKRHQDVEELLGAGIDVYTTLNIQHLESLNDVVAQITGVTIHETVPDQVLDEANEIELVDLPPDELLQRLGEGKVYVPDQAARAIEKFFRKGNLTALRELAMRRAAERVDHQMQAYMQTRSIPGPWPAAERLLVCIGTSPLSERLIRSARRLSDELNAEWLTIYVATPDSVRLSQEKRDLVARALQQAEQLGAKTVTLTGQSVAKTITAYAQQHNITRILVGKTLRSGLDKVLHGDIVEQLIARSGDMDIIVVSGKPESAALTETVASQVHSPWQRYLWGIGLVVLATAINTAVHHWISPTNLMIVYLLAVVVSAGYLGRGPSILVSILGVLAFDYFFVPPRLTFDVSETEYLLTFGGLLGVGLVISQLTARVRDQAEAAENREANTATLYSLSRDLAVAGGLEAVLRAITTHVSQTFGREVVIFFPDPESEEILKSYSETPGFAADEKEIAVAVWTYQHGQSAGRGTATLSASQARYLPLKTAQGIVGVLGVKPKDSESQLPPEQRRLLEAFANQAALAIERVQLADQARKSQLLQETEKLQTALLNSISHDLRTPLVSITGALSSLQDDVIAEDQDTRHSLLDTAREESDRLNRLVGNLLNMTRIEAGAMRISFELSDVQDVIGTALEQVNNRLDDRPVHVDIPDNLPLIPMDFVLINQVLVNLLDNAIKYSPPLTPIEVRAKLAGAYVEIEVMDRGIGIPSEDLQRVFDKFYRVQRPDNVIGTGLGLSICKGIVEAHGGFIGAESRPGGGTTITVALPVRREELKNIPLQEGEA